MTITIQKQHIYWVVVFLLQLLFILWYQGLAPFGSKLPLTSDKLVMSAEEARLVRQAIELVKDDLESGALSTVEDIRDALWGELPKSVRADVLRSFGSPSRDRVVEALETLSKTIEVK